MEENENIYDKIRELLGDFSGGFNILEHQIDVDLQMKYFECSKRLKKSILPVEVLNNANNLYADDISHEDKKDLLVKLASVEDVKGYRFIEKYLKSDPGELKDWTILALQESKLNMESRLLDQSQVFISTGLGGKGNKLRYFVILLGLDVKEFTDFHKNIIKKEFSYTLTKYDAEIEKFEFREAFATIMAVVPFSTPVKKVFDEALEECNYLGHFLQPNFIITNVKKLSFEEIKDYFKKKKLE